MKTTAILGIILAVIGVIALAYQRFTYTTREKSVDLGHVKITIEEKHKHTLPLRPIIGVVAIVGGVILISLAIKALPGN